MPFSSTPSRRPGLNGFADPGWRVLKGDKESVKREGDTLVMKPETSIAHPMIMQSSEIKFSVTSTTFSCIRLRMFCAGTDGAKATNLLLGNTGNEFYSGLESVGRPVPESGSDGNYSRPADFHSSRDRRQVRGFPCQWRPEPEVPDRTLEARRARGSSSNPPGCGATP